MKNWFKAFILLFIAGLMIFFNSLNNKFMMDDYYFLKYPVLSSTKFILSQWNPYGAQVKLTQYYRPLAHIVLNFYYDIFKGHFWQYHLLNLILFAFAASLIILFINKISGNYALAFLAGFFYLIHPINGIVVNYISACVFSFQLIFMLGTILLLWESLERRNNQILYFLSLLFSFLSLFWHESGIMIPFFLSVFILLFRNDSYKKKVLCLIPYYLIILSYIVFRLFFVIINKNILRGASFFHMTGWEYCGTLFRVLMWYIVQLFYPFSIVMQWSTSVMRQNVFWDILGAVSLFLIFILLFIKFSKNQICKLALCWILIGFASCCLAAFMNPDQGVLIEPHWFIFSSIGFFILAANFFLFLLNRTRKGGLIFLFIIVFVWGSISHAYNQLWADQKRYALFWSQQAPNLRLTYFYLAEAYQQEGNFNESRKYYRRALNNNSSDFDMFNNMGVMDLADNNWKSAELNFKRALKINSFHAGLYNNLGNLYLQQGELLKAKEYFDRSLVLDPMLIEPRRSLASIFLVKAEYQKAVDLCLKNLELVNNDTNTLFLLIDIYLKKKDTVSIEKYANRIINNETDPEVLIDFGVLMSQNHFNNIAWDCYAKALRLAPRDGNVYFNAGSLLANMGKYNEAIHLWRLGQMVDPSDYRFKGYIARALKLNSTSTDH